MSELNEFPGVREAVKEVYQRGVIDGMETTLCLLLGRKTDGVDGYPGRLNQSAQEWAERALTAVQGAKEDMT